LPSAASPGVSGNPEFRIKFYNALQQGFLFFNIGEFQRRGHLVGNYVKTFAHIARTAIESVSRIQRLFARSGARVVGGKPHDLLITPDGGFYSTTGDAAPIPG
jgi:hypothetical protein